MKGSKGLQRISGTAVFMLAVLMLAMIGMAVTLTLRPDSAGTYQAWGTFGSGTAHWDRTSDQSNATGVSVTADTASKETMNLQNTSQTGTINNITAYMRCVVTGGSGGTEKAVIVWRTYNTDYESAATTISRTTFTDYSETRATNPNTSAAWTWTEVNNLQIGARASTLGSGETVNCSEFWISTDYTPPNQAPQISLNLPANNTQFNNTQNISFNLTATDDANTTLSCRIYLDDVLNQTNSSTQNNTLANFLITGVSYGSHNWYVNCTDGSASNVSETRVFTITDTIPPATVTNLNESATGQSWIYWSWTNPADSDFNHTEVWLNGTFKTNVSAPTSYYNATGLSSNTTYEIQTHTVDNVGNINTTWVNDTATTQSTPDTTPPATITNLANQSQETTWIYWNWSNPSDADFNHTEVWLNGTFKANVSTPTNYYNATSLSSNTTYQIQTRTVDNNGNINTTWVNSTATTQPAPDTTPPAGVTNLNEIATGQTWIYWNWTNPADADFNHTEVWLNGTFKANVSSPANYYNATSLTASTLYQIQTRTVDNLSNINATWVNDTATTQSPPDTTPPIISAVNASATNTTANITWTTDETSNSTVNYGNTTALGTLQSNSSSVTSHLIALTSLTSATTYYYNVTSCDVSSNCNTTGPYNFTTDANVQIAVADANNSSANVTLQIYDETDVLEGSGSSSWSGHLKLGKKKIRTVHNSGPVKEINFTNVSISNNSSLNIGYDDTPEFGNYLSVYAIDPTALNFTSATVTVTATGTELYKCKNWNFTARSCIDGNWTKVAGISPGENYTFTLTAEDPGYGEAGTTDGVLPNATSNSDSEALIIGSIDELAPGDAVYVKSGDTSEPSADWVQCGYPKWWSHDGVDTYTAFGAWHPFGITTIDGSSLWVADDISPDTVFHITSNGTLLETFDVTISGTRYGITTVNGSEFWTIDNYYNGASFESHVTHYNSTFGLLQTYNITSIVGSDAEGITTVNGSEFWIADPANDKVWKLNSTFGLITSYVISGYSSYATGITTVNGSEFWITDSSKDMVFKTNSTFSKIDEFNATPFGGNNLYGIDTVDGTEFWAVNNKNDNTDRILHITRIVPASWAVQNMTVYWGHYETAGYNLHTADAYKGVVWSPDGAAFYNITDWTKSATDVDESYTLTSGLPTASQLNAGIYLRFLGLENGGGADNMYLDYCYFTLGYIIPDTTAPNITIANPANGSRVNSNPIYLNATTDENATCQYSTNSTFSYGSGTAFNTTGGTIHSTSLGNLTEGAYTYYVKCNDTSGNNNTDANQKSVTFTVDRTPPGKVSSLNETAVGNSWIYWNWTNPDYAALRYYSNGNGLNGILNESESGGNGTLYSNTAYTAGDDSLNRYHSTKFLITNAPNTDVTKLSLYGIRWGTPEASNFIYDISICPTNVSSLTTNWSGNCNGTKTVVADNANLSAIFGNTSSWKYLTFDNAYAMRNSNRYIIFMEYVSGGDADSGEDGWRFKYDITPATNNYMAYNASGTIAAESNILELLLYGGNSDFDHAEVWVDSQFKVNTSANYYNATGFLPDTAHTISIRTADTAGNVNTTWASDDATTSSDDTTPPGTVTNLNESSVGYTWAYWTWTNPADSDFNHTEVWVDDVWKANVTKPANYYNATGFALNTTHTIGTRTSDNTGNVNTTWVNDSASTLADTQAPSYSDLSTNPASPTYSPGQSYQFNATWTDNIAMGTVLFEFDGTNYSTTNVSSIYTKTLTNLAAGNYTYRWYANDTSGNFNNSDAQTYTIGKASPIINLTLNGADSDTSAARLSMVNISAALDTPSGIGTIELFENGTLVNTSSASIFVQRNYTSLGTINWTVRYNETQNYTSAAKTHLLSIVDQSVPQFSNLAESPTEPVTFSPSQIYQFNATWTDDIGISNVILEFAGANYSWLGGQLNKSGNVYSRSFGAMAAGTYNYKWYANDTSGNNASTSVQSYTIDKAITALFLTFSPSSTVTYNTSSSVGCSANNLESVPSLTRNGSAVGNPDVQTLAAGTHNYACTAAATQNYTSASQTGTLTVNKATSTLSINLSPASSIVYGTNATATCFANNAEISPQLYLDGSPIANPYTALLGAGNHTYTCNATGSQNWSAVSASTILQISKASTATTLLLNGSASNLTVTYPAETNASASTSILGVTLYRNGTPVSNADIQTLAAGIYNYTAINPGNENYSSSSATLFATVNKAPNDVNLSINGAINQNVTAYLGNESAVEAAALATATSGTTQLFVNGANVTVPYVANLSVGNYEFLASTAGNENYTANSSHAWLFVKPNVTSTFSGTNFSAVSNYLNISNVTLEISSSGKIAFSEAIVINRSIDVDANVNISNNYIFVNSTALPEFNHSATLYLYNLTFTNPKIMRDGVECSSCTKLSYTGGTLVFTVPSFSAYSAAEGSAGPYCGDGTCNNGETCSSCSTDCGSCSPGGGGGGGWIGNCTENWYCSDWAACSNGVQNRTCSERNKCGTAKNRPNLTQPCKACGEAWVCSEWSECKDGIQTRYCIDQNECGGNRDKPREIQSCEEKPKENEIIIPKLVEVQRAPNPELIALTIAMLFGLVGVLGLRSSQISSTMKRVLELAHIVLVLSIAGLLLMTFAEQPTTALASTVGQVVAGNWSIAATLLGIVGVVGAELALRGFKLPKFRLPKKKLAKPHKLKHVEESEKWKQHQKHLELSERMHAFENALDTRLEHYRHSLESLHRSAQHILKKHKKLKHENAKLRSKGSAGTDLPTHAAHSIQLPKARLAMPKIEVRVPRLTLPRVSLPKLSMRGKRVFASTREALLHAVPKFTLPKFNVPKLSLPKLAVPKLTMPTLSIPKLSIPRIKLPSIKINVPKLAFPRLNIPKISIPNIPKIHISSRKIGRAPETIQGEASASPVWAKSRFRPILPQSSVQHFRTENDVSQILDLSVTEMKITKQSAAIDKRKRAAIARMRAQFGLPARIPSHRHKPVSGFGRRQL